MTPEDRARIERKPFDAMIVEFSNDEIYPVMKAISDRIYSRNLSESDQKAEFNLLMSVFNRLTIAIKSSYPR